MLDWQKRRWRSNSRKITSMTIQHTAYARVGLLGNPSDGYFGKTLAFSASNFAATVTLEPSESLVILPHPVHDPSKFASLQQLVRISLSPRNSNSDFAAACYWKCRVRRTRLGIANILLTSWYVSGCFCDAVLWFFCYCHGSYIISVYVSLEIDCDLVLTNVFEWVCTFTKQDHHPLVASILLILPKCSTMVTSF